VISYCTQRPLHSFIPRLLINTTLFKTNIALFSNRAPPKDQQGPSSDLSNGQKLTLSQCSLHGNAIQDGILGLLASSGPSTRTSLLHACRTLKLYHRSRTGENSILHTKYPARTAYFTRTMSSQQVPPWQTTRTSIEVNSNLAVGRR
jgi:hypothetical protein